jgi:hypothetical protein
MLLAALAPAKQVPPPVTAARDGTLAYVVEANGDRVVDFSAAGFGGGGVAWPETPARIRLEPVAGDNTALIQAALDHVAKLPRDAAGVRGAVLLAPGRFELAGRLRIGASGVVLRGSAGTVLVAIGTDRTAIITVSGAEAPLPGPSVAVAGPYVPVGSRRFQVAATTGLTVGGSVLVTRPSPKSWIEELGMHDSPGRQDYHWRPGSLDVQWERTVTAITDHTVELDVPLTLALDPRHGGGTIAPLAAPARLERCGVERLRLESTFAPGNPLDEQHAWTGVHLGHVRDAWVADVQGAHLAGSLVFVSAGASRVTVQDCLSRAPVSEQAGGRRQTFRTEGQQALFLRCRAEDGRHDFTTGHLAAGPTVFLECRAERTRGFSGAAGSWASGVLFDNVHIDGGALRLDHLETWDQGAGWSAANSVIWQCSAGVIAVRSPPGAINWAVGPWAQFVGDGRWSEVNEFVRPESLYRAQLTARLGNGAARALAPRTYRDEAAAPLWNGPVPPPGLRPAGRVLARENGWLTLGGRLAIGAQTQVAWWRGHTLPKRAKEIGPALTRFVPNHSGAGLTDDLAEVAAAMEAAGQVALRHNWGLWYDRRRDDHQRVRRPDADVAAPFFEMPWARAGAAGGETKAWDGLSRYDLTRYNPWYFDRLREFAEQARARGLVLVSETYFQHNILEAGAHWAEFPWRSANNVNGTGFPEPPPYADSDGTRPSSPDLGKRIFMAEQFYDITHPTRAALHRAYIRHCLASLADQPNVVHTLSAEFSGPLPFAQFWLDVCAEAIRADRLRPLLALSAPKDVQDAILADPARAAHLAVIDLKYWWRTEKGTEFAPPGGVRLAPRQHEREWKGGRPSAVSLARMAREYRQKFPHLAVITSHDATAEPWSWLAAGGSWPRLPRTTAPELLAAVPQLQPVAEADLDPAQARQWTLRGADGSRLVAALGSGPVRIDLRGEAGTYVAHRIDPMRGTITGAGREVAAGQSIELEATGPGATVYWIVRR